MWRPLQFDFLGTIERTGRFQPFDPTRTVCRSADVVGRRPVLAASLFVEASAMAVFLAADGPGWLLAARIVQGLATGAALGVLGAFLLDLQPAPCRLA